MADNLTDTELRKELKALGMQNVGPITSTTRSILLKKLNHLKAAKRKSLTAGKNVKPTRTMFGFSSDESDQEGDPQPSSTMSSNNRRRSTRGKINANDITGTVDSKRTVSRPALRNKSQNDQRRSLTSSVMGHSNVNKSMSVAASGDGGEFESSDSNSGDDDDADYSIHIVRDAGTNTSILSDTSINMNQSKSRNDTKRGDKLKKDMPDRRNALSRPEGPSDSIPRSTNRNNSSIKSRALIAKSNTDNNEAHHQHHDQNHTNHISASATNQKTEFTNEKDISKQGFKTTEDPRAYRCTQYISLVLVIVVAVFFVVLAFTYISIREGGSDDQHKGNNLMVCGPGALTTEGMTCFKQTEVNAALPVLNALFVHLSEQAGKRECSGDSVKELVEDGVRLHEIDHFVKEKFGERYEYSQSVLFSLIINNPHWKMRVCDANKEDTANPSRVMWVVCDEPYIPVVCRIQKFMTRVVYGTMAVLIGVFVAVMTWMYLRYNWLRQEEETRKVYDLVERIIDICKQQQERHAQNKNVLPYVPIPHIRDMLIPPSKRSQMQKLWDKAVKFLAANESRIREESQIVEGEEFSVWRWTQIQVEQASSNGKKVWQGQAFGENKELSMNMPLYSPTQCLKIRNMFDPDIEYGNEWHINIQDAILEKCKDHGGIVHIAVDKNSKEGCVYLKCVSTEAAGQAYKALHGWWFDGCLVTVKYLRLERYHERFPDAVNCNKPLSPSTNQMRSLSQPYHRSPLERM